MKYLHLISLAAFWLPFLIFYLWLGIAPSYSAYFGKLKKKNKNFGIFFRISLWSISIPILIRSTDYSIALFFAAGLILLVGVAAGRQGKRIEGFNHGISATGGILVGWLSLIEMSIRHGEGWYLTAFPYCFVAFGIMTYLILPVGKKPAGINNHTLWIEAFALTFLDIVYYFN